MRCDEFQVRLDHLLDNRLDPELDWMLTSHADDCEDCRGELLGQQLLRESMDLFELPELADSFADDVTAVALQQRFPVRRKRSAVLWFAGLAVAASLVVSVQILDPGSWRGSVDDQMSGRKHAMVETKSATPNANQDGRLGPFLGWIKSGVSQSYEIVQQPRVPSRDELLSLRYIESDEIPGVRPLKTSLDVTISLLKRTIPGRSSSGPKQPTTSQISAESWHAV